VTAHPASEQTPGQNASRAARLMFLKRLDEFPWWREYVALRAEGWDWRKAAYIAWAASPARGRVPPTQEELAIDVLGMRSARTIRNWRKKYPEMDGRVSALLIEPLLAHRADVLAALVSSATDPAARSASDRRTFLQVVGMLGVGGGKEQTQQVQVQEMDSFSGLTDDELRQVVRNLDVAVPDTDEGDNE